MRTLCLRVYGELDSELVARELPLIVTLVTFAVSIDVELDTDSASFCFAEYPFGDIEEAGASIAWEFEDRHGASTIALMRRQSPDSALFAGSR